MAAPGAAPFRALDGVVQHFVRVKRVPPRGVRAYEDEVFGKLYILAGVRRRGARRAGV